MTNTETTETFKTTFAAIRAVRDLTGWDLRTSRDNVAALVSIGNNGGDLGVLNGACFDTPKGFVAYEVVVAAVVATATVGA